MDSVQIDFLSFDLAKILNQDPNKKPVWGTMTLIEMLEHLVVTLESMAIRTEPPEGYEHEKFERSRAFVLSMKPLPRNYDATYFPRVTNTRFSNLAEAISTLESERKKFFQLFVDNPSLVVYHPNFGRLDKKHVYALQNKHFTHHFTQLDLLS